MYMPGLHLGSSSLFGEALDGDIDVICFQITEVIVCNGKSDNNIPVNHDREEVKLLNNRGGRKYISPH